jgi:predicted TIM-barrel fold metal-dependent hydrolase
MNSRIGIPVVDAHAHFFTVNTMQAWLKRGRTVQSFSNRTQSRTNMTKIELPDDSWDVAQKWIDEMDKYGVQAVGFMVGEEAYDEFIQAKKRFPQRFMGYVNIDPKDPEAPEKVKKAYIDGLQGIKLYPSNWRGVHVYDELCYPIYEEALRQGLLVFLHFGITIGGQADLRSGNPIDLQIPSRDFPDLNFIIAHFGAGWFREVLLLQYQSDNVYMDTSGSNSWMRYLPYDLNLQKIFERALIAGGADKILFGTDSTFFPRGWRIKVLEDQFKAISALTNQKNPLLDDGDINKIFRENILTLTSFKT